MVKKQFRYKIIKLVLLSIFIVEISYAQTTQPQHSISGIIKDAQNGEDLIGVNVYSPNLQTGTVSNNYGFYSILLPKGAQQIIISYIGYKDSVINLNLSNDLRLDIELKPVDEILKDIVVTAEKEDRNVSGLRMSSQDIEMKSIKELPISFGETDIVKTIQLVTPGVQSAGEGSNSFSVRGGSPDHNQILLDEAIVYNPTHLLGFFSTFNTNSIKDVSFYKGGFAANYGGKIGSVMDIRMKDGNNKKLQVSGGLGLLASNLTVEAPIVKDKGSFIVSGRRSYFDMLVGSGDEAMDRNKVYFYDVNAKANYTLSKKDRIFVSGYMGRDEFKFGSDFGLNWGNITGTLRWNHIINDKFFSNTSLILSDFSYGIALGTGGNQTEFKAGIRDYSLKQDFNWYANAKNKVSFGFQSTHHLYKTGKVESGENSNYNDWEIGDKYAWENNFYISNQHKINERIAVQYGLRASIFSLIGPSDEFIFENPDDRHPTDTLTAKNGEFYKNYFNLEPRLLLRYQINDNSSLKASYDRTSQNTHLASNTQISLPTDLQLPSSRRIKPEIADQFAFGYFQNFMNNMFETSVEAYYKKLQNQLEFRDGSDFLADPFIERNIYSGEGTSYGAELFVKKNKGNTTGFISYTLSWAKRKFDEINNGKEYFANTDRRNILNIALSQKLNQRWSVSASWSYADGNAVSFPTGKMKIDGNNIAIYSEKNAYRMPSNHHLDLSATLKGAPNKRFKSEWNFSIYNVYGRKNAWNYSFRESEENPGQMEAVKLYFLSVLPSVTWSFKF